MVRKSTWWRVRLWIACCAILLNALAPSVSHALSAARGYVPAADICSAGDGYAAQERWHLLADCGYCLTHAGSEALPPPAPFAPALLDVADAAPFQFHLAQPPWLALTAQPARGPPSL
jgi:hypothetical protein